METLIAVVWFFRIFRLTFLGGKTWLTHIHILATSI